MAFEGTAGTTHKPRASYEGGLLPTLRSFSLPKPFASPVPSTPAAASTTPAHVSGLPSAAELRKALADGTLAERFQGVLIMRSEVRMTLFSELLTVAECMQLFESQLSQTLRIMLKTTLNGVAWYKAFPASSQAAIEDCFRTPPGSIKKTPKETRDIKMVSDVTSDVTEEAVTEMQQEAANEVATASRAAGSVGPAMVSTTPIPIPTPPGSVRRASDVLGVAPSSASDTPQSVYRAKRLGLPVLSSLSPSGQFRLDGQRVRAASPNKVSSQAEPLPAAIASDLPSRGTPQPPVQRLSLLAGENGRSRAASAEAAKNAPPDAPKGGKRPREADRWSDDEAATHSDNAEKRVRLSTRSARLRDEVEETQAPFPDSNLAILYDTETDTDPDTNTESEGDEDADDDADSDAENDVDSGANDKADNDANNNADATAIWLTPSGKLYNKYIGRGGMILPTGGVLIPDGYQLLDNASTPWVCPIRSCRCMFSSLVGLGAHFSRGHRDVILNDNLDGTLSITRRVEGATRLSARVFSQKAPSVRNAEPLVEPHQPKPSMAMDTSSSSSTLGLSGPVTAEAPGAPAAAVKRNEKRNGKPLLKDEIIMAHSNREYAMLLDGTSAFGALIPDGYELSTYAGHPWICPVRNCRRVFPAVVNLGAHFTRQHRQCKLNDNGDGTLSNVGSHPDSRPIIASQKRKTAAELGAIAEPSLPGATQGMPGVLPPAQVPVALPDSDASDTNSGGGDGGGGSGRLSLAALKQTDLRTPVPSDEVGLWHYTRASMRRHTTDAAPKKSNVPYYLRLPRVRNIRWNDEWITRNPFSDSQPRDVSSFLIQVTGEYSETPCKHCVAGKGPYEGCVIMARNAPSILHANVSCCANCLYHCGQTYCDLKKTMRDRFSALFPDLDQEALVRYMNSGAINRNDMMDHEGLRRLSERYATANRQAVDSNASVDAINEVAKATDEKTKAADETAKETAASLYARRSERIAIKESVAEVRENPDEGPAARDSPEVDPKAPVHTRDVQVHRPAHEQSVEHESPLISAGQAQPTADLLDMEEWEMAPGRLQKSQTVRPGVERVENVAFSNAFLSSNQMIRIDHNLAFRVEVVRPGMTHNFDPEPRTTRICSLAAGKLRVKVDDTEFVIGPHGMFKVRPGATLSVQNRIYVDAYLHISAVQHA